MLNLEFEEEALREIAKKAIERKTGARGLRSIIEGIMLDVMYDLPSRDDVQKCIITKETVIHKSRTKIYFERRYDYRRKTKNICLNDKPSDYRLGFLTNTASSYRMYKSGIA